MKGPRHGRTLGRSEGFFPFWCAAAPLAVHAGGEPGMRSFGPRPTRDGRACRDPRDVSYTGPSPIRHRADGCPRRPSETTQIPFSSFRTEIEKWSTYTIHPNGSNHPD